MLYNCIITTALLALAGVPYAARRRNRAHFWRHYAPWLCAAAFAAAAWAAYLGAVSFMCLLADAAEI